jgi:hypothetical protein
VFIVAVLAGLIYVVLGLFWLEFIGLSLVYSGAAIGIIHLFAKRQNSIQTKKNKTLPKKERRKRIKTTDELWKKETWFFVFLGAILVTLLIALFNWGPAVLLPGQHPTPESRAWMTDAFHHLWSKTPQPHAKIPTTPPTWATRTWFWWKALSLYLYAMIAYCIVVFWEDLFYAAHEAMKILKKQYEEEKKKRKSTPTTPPPNNPKTAKAGGTTTTTTPPTPSASDSNSDGGWWKFLLRVGVFEIMAEIAHAFFEGRRRATN